MVSIVNATRFDWNQDLDLTSFRKVCQVVPHFDEAGVDPTDEQILERAQGATILITKEIPISAEVCSKLPDSVKCI